MTTKLQKIAAEVMAQVHTGGICSPARTIRRAAKQGSARCGLHSVRAREASHEMIRLLAPHRFAPLQAQRND